MDNRENLIDAALDTLPLAPTPPGFTARVMARLSPQPAPVFHLDFLDLALPGFFALCATAALGGSLALLAMLNPSSLQNIRLQLQVALLHFSNLARLPRLPNLPEQAEPWLLAGGLCAGVILLLFLALLVWLVLDRAPRFTNNRLP